MAAVATVLPTSFQIVDGLITGVVHGWRERASGSHSFDCLERLLSHPRPILTSCVLLFRQPLHDLLSAFGGDLAGLRLLDLTSRVLNLAL
jgi:hypothetical protein